MCHLRVRVTRHSSKLLASLKRLYVKDIKMNKADALESVEIVSHGNAGV